MNCKFEERSPRQWHYSVEPDGRHFDHGPFRTFEEAENHLRDHYPNPGTIQVKRLPGCKHDLIRKDRSNRRICRRCGWILDN